MLVLSYLVPFVIRVPKVIANAFKPLPHLFIFPVGFGRCFPRRFTHGYKTVIAACLVGNWPLRFTA